MTKTTIANVTVYSEADVYLVRKGEIAVEFWTHDAQGFQDAPKQFARFRSHSRAHEFASAKRSEGCSVKAWTPISYGQSRPVQL